MKKQIKTGFEEAWELLCVQQEKKEIARLLEWNKKTEAFGLTLSQEQVQSLMRRKRETLRETGRVEFQGNILDSIIYSFCDSPYVQQDTYEETLADLQEIFFLYKNESMDLISDGELLDFMRRQFDKVCFGDLEYLKTTCLERFSRLVREGGFWQAGKRKNEYDPEREEDIYEELSEEVRWEEELYAWKLEELES